MVTRKVYHGTFYRHPGGCPAPSKRAGPFGLHFGTMRSAKERLEHVAHAYPGGSKAFIYEAVIRPTQMLSGVMDPGLWNSPRDVAYVLLREIGGAAGYASPEWNYIDLFGRNYASFGSFRDKGYARQLRFIFDTIRRLGYDAISYKNRFEDKGKTSYVVLDPSIIQSCKLAEEGVVRP